MEYLLLRAHKDQADGAAGDDGEEADDGEASGLGRIAVANIKTEELGEIVISAIKLKRTLPEWLKPSKTINRVFHAVNGQVQFKQTRGYLSQSCGFPALKDRVVIIVDASNLTFEAHNEVWKGDREHIRNTIIGERYQDVVTAAIKTSQPLIELQKEVAREEFEQSAKTERDDEQGPGDHAPFARRRRQRPRCRPQGIRRQPTFLRFEDKARELGVAVPINRTRPVAARTDAENGYLQRADNKGTLIVDPAIYASFGLNAHLYDGRLTIFLDPVQGAVKVGDKITLKVGLQDPSMAQPVQDRITIKISEETAPSKKKTKIKSKTSAGDAGNKEGDGKPAPTHGLPQYRLLTEDGRKVGDIDTLPWPEGFNEYDGGSIEDFGEQGALYKINYDNVYHLKYRRAARGGDVGRDVITEKYILSMRIMLMGYEHALRALKAAKNGDDAGLAEFQDDFPDGRTRCSFDSPGSCRESSQDRGQIGCDRGSGCCGIKRR